MTQRPIRPVAFPDCRPVELVEIKIKRASAISSMPIMSWLKWEGFLYFSNFRLLANPFYLAEIIAQNGKTLNFGLFGMLQNRGFQIGKRVFAVVIRMSSGEISYDRFALVNRQHAQVPDGRFLNEN